MQADYSGASTEAIQHHYDLGNDFYSLWLDESLTYSCALWGEGDSLLDAQHRKLDYMIEGAKAAGARRVLDIGCGWGSLARRLVEEHGVEHVVGLTLSDAQAQHIEDAGIDGVEVHVQNWADHEPDEPYDAIISIGAFEHFAAYGLPRDERVKGYRRFFKSCREMLVPDGRLALQTCAKGSNVRLNRETTAELRFIIETIFPESELPWLSEIALASEKVMDPVSVRNDPEHYSRTCAEWLQRLQARRDEALELVGERAVADYERYLEVTVRHFANRHLGLLRLIFQSV